MLLIQVGTAEAIVNFKRVVLSAYMSKKKQCFFLHLVINSLHWDKQRLKKENDKVWIFKRSGSGCGNVNVYIPLFLLVHILLHVVRVTWQKLNRI